MFLFLEIILLLILYVVFLLLRSLIWKRPVKRFVARLRRVFRKNSRAQGELLRDIGLGSFINAAYIHPKDLGTDLLILASICATIIGILLKEENKNV
jgi:hypothetical protein